MAAPTSSIYRGWFWDKENSALDVYFGLGAATDPEHLLHLTNTTLAPGGSDGAALGTTSLMWSDLLLASGGVINFNNGDVTITHATDVLTFATSKAAANMADGYGCWEVDTTMTGTATGHFAASSSWVNMVSGTAATGGVFVTPHNDGLYEDEAYTITGAYLVMGQRMQAVLGETGYTFLTLWSVNSNRTITALFDYNSAGALGMTTATPTAGASRSVAFCRDSNGAILYMRLYDDATT